MVQTHSICTAPKREGACTAVAVAVFSCLYVIRITLSNLNAEAGHDRLFHNAGVDAELILELEFDQTLGW